MNLANVAVAALGSCLLACAAAPDPVAAPPTRGRLTFVNTSDQCPLPAAVTLTSQGALLGAVNPGDRADLALTHGVHVVAVTPDGRAEAAEVQSWRIGDAPAAAWFGCVEPRFLGERPGRVRLWLVNHPHACDAGPHGLAAWRLDGAPLAELLPGGRAERWVAPGSHRLDQAVAGAALTRRRVALSGAGATLAAGCDGRPRSQARLLPLTVTNPRLTCAPVIARVAGRTIPLDPGRAWTLLLPRGVHEVAFTSADGAALGAVERVTLDDEGRVVERSHCIERGPTR
jgi:hypothetical protein